MVSRTRGARVAMVAGALLATTAAHAVIVFSDVVIQSPPLSNGSSFVTGPNYIDFFLPNAAVGDGEATRTGLVNIRYNATSTTAMVSNTLTINLGNIITGSGKITFLESIYELDSNGNEIGGPIASHSKVFTAADDPFYTHTMTFAKPVERFRAKKAFDLRALDSDSYDLARLAIVNQNIGLVPEPGTMAAMALGSLALLRRRRR